MKRDRPEDTETSPNKLQKSDSGQGTAPAAIENGAPTAQPRSGKVRKGTECPYLDTIARQNLDFDFEKCCVVSLSPINVYACLVCGKYFQGRGLNTNAFTHSLETNHHMFMKLENGKVYCLPDGYEVEDRSLEVIRYVLNPTFKREESPKRDAIGILETAFIVSDNKLNVVHCYWRELCMYSIDKIASLDREKVWARALDGQEYMPGLVGLNNMKNNDYVNVTVQILARVVSIRNFFLDPANYESCRSLLVQRFGELLRKIWNPRNFKGQVSPHEFMQAVMSSSHKRFTIEQQADALEFWAWFINTLHHDLTGGKRSKPSIISKCFQGELEVTTEAGTGKAKEPNADGQVQDVVDRVPFLFLGLDLPPAPLYKDVMETNIIPQVPIFDLLRKFNNQQTSDDIKAGRRRFRLTKLPSYMVLHIKRFTKNNFFVEKNPTIVNFPVKNLELRDVVPVPDGKAGKAQPSKYDLIGNLVHDGKPDAGTYRLHVHRKSEDAWYEVQDLRVTDILPQMVALSETYMQVYELKRQT